MSLKNIIRKSIASFGAISLVLGHCSLCGIGLLEVIAENASMPEIGIEWNNEKYVQYNYNKTTEVDGQETDVEVKGIAVQSKLSVYPVYEQDTYLPTERVEISVTLPMVNGLLPEKLVIVEASTKSTTGKENNTNLNQNYDSNSGLLTVSYENTPDENENIYMEHVENAKDEFEIIYTYPAEAYTGNEEEITTASSVNTKITFKTKAGSATTEKEEAFEIVETENKGDILTFGITELENTIHKGFMYSNVQNQTNYDTEYKTVSTLAVLNSGVANSVTMELKDAEFILNDEEETKISTNGNVVYKSTEISKSEFDKILGQEGTLEIYTGETLLATVKYLEVSEDENIVKKLAITYSDGEVKMLSNDDEMILVENKQEVSSLKINISKPVAEGFMHFKNQNAIKATTEYEADLHDIKYILTEGIVNEYSNPVKIKLSEPETKISVVSSNTNFSTLQESKTTLTITLDDTNSSTKLFDNPTITIKLPEGIENGNISNAEIVNGNGLTIKNTNANENIITIELEGKQTSYDITNISGGVSIVMDIENIDYKDTIPTHEDKIEVTCTQGNEQVKVSQNVNIVSKPGVLMLTKVSNYDETENVLTTLENANINIQTEAGEEEKHINKEIIFVNNYNETITNVEIVGNLGTNDSTFSAELLKAIEVNKTDVNVYYSEDGNTWKEEYSNSAKLYKIVPSNKELQSKESIKVNLSLKIPAGLHYNEVSNIEAEISYIQAGQNRKEVNSIKIETAKVEQLGASLYENDSNISVGVVTIAGGQEINPGDEVHEGQILKTKLTLVNNSSEEVIYKLKTTIENAVYYEKYETGQIYNENEDPDTRFGVAGVEDVHREYEEIKIPAISSTEFEYQYMVSKDVDNVTNKINLVDENNNNVIDEINIQNPVKPAKMQLLLQYAYNEEVAVMANMNTVLYVKNYQSRALKDVKVNLQLPDELKISKWEQYGEQKIEVLHNATTKALRINIDEIPANETIEILLVLEVSLDTNLTEKNVSLNASCTYNDETYLSNNFSKKVHQSRTNLDMKVENDVEDGIVEVGDKVKYTVNISNQGSLDLNDSSIIFTPSKGMKMNKAQIIYADGTSKTIEIKNNSNFLYSLNIKKIDNITIIYEVTVDYTLEEMESSFKLSGNYFNFINKTSKLKGYIEEKEDTKQEKPPKYEEIIKPETNVTIKDFIGDETLNQPEGPTGGQPGGETDNPPEEEIEYYTISGTAWLDSNKDGERNNSEAVLENISVILVDKNTGKMAVDSNGNNIKTKTDSNGKYTFSNLVKGNYAVLFEFDTVKYTVTTYQKQDIDENKNSDAIVSKVTINGEDKNAGVTDTINLTSNKENVDIGLIENAKFDLCLDKEITKITVINSKGTETYEYDEGHTAKVDLVAKYMSGANVIVNYKFTITNNGDVAGYVNSLVDSLPSGLEFSSELNKDWYKGNDGGLYTTSLSSKAIKPGESIDVELVLTKTMTTENAGTFVNNASLEKISNLENIQEKQETLEDNESSAILIISIKTGSVIMYIGITMLCIAIIGVGCYLINKKVLRRTI